MSYTSHLRVNSGVFKDNESETEAKTNNEPRVCPLFIGNPLFVCKEHAQSLLFACKEHVQSLLFACKEHVLLRLLFACKENAWSPLFAC